MKRSPDAKHVAKPVSLKGCARGGTQPFRLTGNRWDSRSPVTIEREQQSRFRTEMTISAQYLRETLLCRFDVAGLLASQN